ncbi:hypothetical protein TYRP_009719 [Tyrophagus putrescentiae]|nr:hypothetical protein TYRP_009719 [Tyrophagus putrescentiae]
MVTPVITSARRSSLTRYVLNQPVIGSKVVSSDQGEGGQRRTIPARSTATAISAPVTSSDHLAERAFPPGAPLLVTSPQPCFCAHAEDDRQALGAVGVGRQLAGVQHAVVATQVEAALGGNRLRADAVDGHVDDAAAVGANGLVVAVALHGYLAHSRIDALVGSGNGHFGSLKQQSCSDNEDSKKGCGGGGGGGGGGVFGFRSIFK